MGEQLLKIEEYRKENPNRLAAEQLVSLEQEILHPRKGIISDEYLDYKFWCQGLPSRQECFAAYLKDEILPPRELRILEVGCGRYAKLSVLLKGWGHVMTCMDPRAEPVEDAEIVVRREAFLYENVELKDYDYVVAQEPCDATEHIVRACTGRGVPFAIVLCGVPHERIGGGMPKDVYEWYACLAGIDPVHTRLDYVELYPKMRVAVIRSEERFHKNFIERQSIKL